MLTEEEIKHALHASRVGPMTIAVPHGPFGWEHMAQNVARFLVNNEGQEKKTMPALEVPIDTWKRLEHLANEATRSGARPISVSDVAVAILQQYVADRQ